MTLRRYELTMKNGNKLLLCFRLKILVNGAAQQKVIVLFLME